MPCVNSLAHRAAAIQAVVCGALWFVALGFPPMSVAEPVTFSRDLAPVLFARCASCHRPDGAAPFSLLTYGEAKQRAHQLAAVTKAAVMPPWKPDPGDPPFIGERRLTDAEIELFSRWVSDGMPEGDRSLLPQRPRWPSGWQLGEPDLIVSLPDYTLRADGSDVFRNFVILVPINLRRYVRGLEFRPSSPAVHHANIRIDVTSASRRLDDADPAPGYEGMIARSADYPQGHFLGWTPGQVPPLAPDGLAWRLEPGADFVVQLHLLPTGKPERIQPAIGLYFANEAPTRTPSIVRLGRQNIDIPAGASDYRTADSYVLPVDVEVLAVQPHAHYRAREMNAWATLPDGREQKLVTIRRWDFAWQDQYRYASPISLPAGTKIGMAFVFDNSQANVRNPDHPPKRVSWGWRTSDEMGDLWIQVIAQTDADRVRLERDARRKMAAEDAVGSETLIQLNPDYVNLRNDAALLYLELGQPERALTHFLAAERLQPRSAAARYNVGVALEAAGRTAEAAKRYEDAVRLDPKYSLAHNNLGTLLLAQGRVPDARRQYERAVESDPLNAEAQNNLGGILLGYEEAQGSIAHLEQATRLRPTYPEAHFNLARAYAFAGRPVDALREANLAAEQAAEAGKTQLSEQIHQFLELWK